VKASRAQQILQADDRIEVQLNGESVWIDSVDQVTETAKVHASGNPTDAKVVAVGELEEVK
jgi:small acid-soluble spore protein H (minor)